MDRSVKRSMGNTETLRGSMLRMPFDSASQKSFVTVRQIFSADPAIGKPGSPPTLRRRSLSRRRLPDLCRTVLMNIAPLSEQFNFRYNITACQACQPQYAQVLRFCRFLTVSKHAFRSPAALLPLKADGTAAIHRQHAAVYKFCGAGTSAITGSEQKKGAPYACRSCGSSCMAQSMLSLCSLRYA